jgi:hypothetical protein
MRILLAFTLSTFVGCSSQPRFIHVGGSTDLFVMFDSSTAQACYAGTEEALRDSIAAANTRASEAEDLSKPFTTAALPFSVAIEERKVEQEYKRRATAERMEAERLDRLHTLPSCQSLLDSDGKNKSK